MHQQQTNQKHQVSQSWQDIPPQKNTKFLKAVGISVIVLAIVALVGALNSNGGNEVSKQSGQAVVSNTATVQVSNNGFMPATIKVAKGTTIEWNVQDPASTHIVAANPYPSHQDLPGLVSQQLGDGAKYSYQFNKAGTYNYHDDLNPELNGTVVVE